MSEFKLTLKRSFDGWSEVGGVKFKLKYPSIQQGKKMERMAIAPFKYERLEGNKEASFVLTGVDETAHIEYKRYCVRVWIENWEGMTENDKPVPCELVDDPEGGKYLKEDLWWGLTRDVEVLRELFKQFENEVGLKESDKKKLDTE